MEELKSYNNSHKPLIREKLIQTKAFSTLSSYLWAAVGVGIAMQEPFERLKSFSVKNPKEIVNGIADFGKKFGQSFKEFIGADKAGLKDYIINKCKQESLTALNKPKPAQIAGRALLACAMGSTLLGNFFTLTDFNKDRGRKPNASTSIIDDNKEKVVC